MALARRLGQFAVQRHGDDAGKTRTHPSLELRGQVDLGNQDEGLAALGEGLFDQAQVHLGLAAAGDAVQQPHTEGATLHRIDRSRLFVGQRRRHLGGRHLDGTPGPPLGRLCALEPGRQGLQQDFTERRLIVGARKPAKLHEIGRQRRQVTQDGAGRLELGSRHFARGSDLDDNADALPAPEGYAHPEAGIGGSALLAQVVEQSMQRQVKGNAEDGHRRRGSEHREHQAHDRARVFHSPGKPVDNIVDFSVRYTPTLGESMG